MLTNGSRFLQRKPQVPEIKNKKLFLLNTFTFLEIKEKKIRLSFFKFKDKVQSSYDIYLITFKLLLKNHTWYHIKVFN